MCSMEVAQHFRGMGRFLRLSCVTSNHRLCFNVDDYAVVK